jgi:hypothetical protein
MPALLANWSCWPLAQLINFTVIPLDLRILYVNLLSIAWTAYISRMASDAATPAGAPAPEPVPAAAAVPPPQDAAGSDAGRSKGGGPALRGGAGAAAASGARPGTPRPQPGLRRGRRAGPTSV